MIPRLWQAALLLLGTILGVGMFGIPFVFVKAGFLTGLLGLLGIAFVATVVHLAYAEVVLKTPSLHRLPGYAALYFGERAGWLARISHFSGLGGALLAYVVLGGSFLNGLAAYIFPAAPLFLGPLAFYLFGVAIIFWNIRFESMANAVLTLGLIAAIVFAAFTLAPSVSFSSYAEFSPSKLGIPYGVLLFSMAGAAVIPDLRRLLLKNDLKKIKGAIIAGTLLAAAVYAVFAFFVVGSTGEATSADAITGLAEKIGSGYLIIGGIIGFLAAITSFIPLGLVMKGMLVSDFGLKPEPAWLATALVPGGLYLLGFHDFIGIISLVGAVTIGLDSIFILLLHRKAAGRGGSRGLKLILSSEVRVILLLVFAAGIMRELYVFFR